MMPPDQLAPLMASSEDERLKFKEARTGFHFDKLVQYCASLANEEGGDIVLGVTDRRPRQVLCRRYYKMTGEKGAYTRKKGLDRETNKALLLKHIEENKDTGSRLSELM